MSAILLKASYPTSISNDIRFQLIQNENEKNEYLNLYRCRSKDFAKKTNKPQVIKLDFIYPDHYTETVLLKAR